MLGAAVILISLGVALAGTYECQVGKYGKLSMFTGEPGNIELPCKYILAEMNCGNYHVKVTGGSTSDPESIFRYSPDTAWVKVQLIDNPRRVFIARTDVANFEDEKRVWNVKTDLSNMRPDVFDYDMARQGAVVSVPGTFEVFFGADRTLKVSCSASSFSNTPYPMSMCGDGMARMNIQGRDRRALFAGGNIVTEKSYSITYHILNNTRVTQSTQCSGIARKFQRCDPSLQAEAIARCSRTFSDRSLSSCLNVRPNRVNAFRLCIKMTGCNKDEDVETGPEEVCKFFAEQLVRRDCVDEWAEIEKEMPDCKGYMNMMMSK